MENQFSRTELLLGVENMKKLHSSRVAIFGIGGVGGYVVEALARSGVSDFLLVDDDKVCLSNINRQIIATMSTIGRYKVDIMKDRILDINPSANVSVRRCFYLPENAHEFDLSRYDYIVDAVDTVTAKLEIICNAKKAGVRVISSMGAGNKLDPTQFEVEDIYKTSVCPLAKVMRRELKKRGIDSLKVVYSKEKPLTPISYTDEDNASYLRDSGESSIIIHENTEIDIDGTSDSAITKVEYERVHARRRSTPGSTAFVPSVVGLIIASEVVKDLTT